MAEKKPIEMWGAVLNIQGQPLDISEAMLLHLGHLNARMDLLLTANQDMQMRILRMELYIRAKDEAYERLTRSAAALLSNGSVKDGSASSEER